jgi:putrescine transport system permease protein
MGRPGVRLLGRRCHGGIDPIAAIARKPVQNPLKNLLAFKWPSGRHVVIGVPYLWLLACSMVPFFIILKLSFSEMEISDPFGTVLTYADGVVSLKIKLSNYLFLAQDDLYLLTYINSIKFAAITTAFCLAIGYPFAYFMARAKSSIRPTLLMLVMLPFWTSFLLRIYAWKGMLDDNGVVNNFMISIGAWDTPLHMMHTPFSLMIGMVYSYLPFMILPLYTNLSKMDVRYIEAAADLGSTPWSTFWRVTVPLSKGGIIAGSMLVFIPCIGEFVIPELLGGPETSMIGHVLWDEFFSNNDWPMASAVTVVVILLILVPMGIYNKYQTEQSGQA